MCIRDSTQGLVFLDNTTLVESAGLYGQSAIRYINVSNMAVLQEKKMDRKYFAEGCDVLRASNGSSKIIQLTWQENAMFTYDQYLNILGSSTFPRGITEGWGITHRVDLENGTNVINFYVTDGSNQVFVVDPETNKIKRAIEVTDKHGNPVYRLNELEFIRGKLFANIYMTTQIAVINVDTGIVERLVQTLNLAIIQIP
eukprot:TRINITY_DN10936_c0_g1_i4.p1 TRINITY_DN10936_c0_g1~~TRINITY_DN10936_c0_g1_i4.p1  ORF type:complete len:218 (-),score=29.00 TRINITY_DN10936_c0_g1_i4:271-867(-)